MVEKNIGSLALTVNQMVDQLSHAYISLIKSNVSLKSFPSVMLWGPPGVGKSQGIRQVAKQIEEKTEKKVEKKVEEQESEPAKKTLDIFASLEAEKPTGKTYAFYLSDENVKKLKDMAGKKGISASKLLDHILSEVL